MGAHSGVYTHLPHSHHSALQPCSISGAALPCSSYPSQSVPALRPITIETMGCHWGDLAALSTTSRHLMQLCVVVMGHDRRTMDTARANMLQLSHVRNGGTEVPCMVVRVLGCVHPAANRMLR